MRNDKDKLLDVLEAIKLIEKYLPSKIELHQLNEMEFLGVVKCIETIGEACKSVSEDLRNKYK